MVVGEDCDVSGDLPDANPDADLNEVKLKHVCKCMYMDAKKRKCFC